jgi:hypothetical protein
MVTKLTSPSFFIGTARALKIFENLIIDLLRARYETDRLELFFDENKGYPQNISTVINNLKENKSEFAVFTRVFDEDFFRSIARAGASVHLLDIIINPKLYEP